MLRVACSLAGFALAACLVWIVVNEPPQEETPQAARFIMAIGIMSAFAILFVLDLTEPRRRAGA